jgi:hypothetical protein
VIAGRDVGAAEAFLRELAVMVAAASREQAGRGGLLR